MAYLEFEFDSKTLKRQVSFEAIIPYENFEGPYPTLYLLHGLGANESLARALKGHAVGDKVYVEVNPDLGYYVVIKSIEPFEDDVPLRGF